MPTETFTSNQVTVLTLPMDGVTEDDGILITGRFVRTDDKAEAYPKKVVLWNYPVKPSKAALDKMEKAAKAQAH